MATLTSDFLKEMESRAGPVHEPQPRLNRCSEILFAAALLFVLMGTAFLLVGFALWSEVMLRYQEFQSYVGHLK